MLTGEELTLVRRAGDKDQEEGGARTQISPELLPESAAAPEVTPLA